MSMKGWQIDQAIKTMDPEFRARLSDAADTISEHGGISRELLVELLVNVHGGTLRAEYEAVLDAIGGELKPTAAQIKNEEIFRAKLKSLRWL